MSVAGDELRQNGQSSERSFPARVGFVILKRVEGTLKEDN